VIRPAAQDDVPRIVEMVAYFLDATPYGEWLRFEPLQLAALAANLIEFEHGFLEVAVSDRTHDAGLVVGLLGGVLVPEPYSQQQIAEELVWWMAPDYRAGTDGPKLLRSFEEWARQHGAVLVKMVAPELSPVGAFYRRSGYTAIEIAYAKRL
jgi:GNAT superfamily N-acetyltransferase